MTTMTIKEIQDRVNNIEKILQQHHQAKEDEVGRLSVSTLNLIQEKMTELVEKMEEISNEHTN